MNDLIVSNKENEAIIRNVILSGSLQTVNITIRDQVISEITENEGKANWVCFPPFADLHMHASRAFNVPTKLPSSFEDSVRMTIELLDNFGEEDYKKCSHQLFAKSFSHGTTKVRTHADIDLITKLKGISGTIAAKEKVADRMDIEVVSFATGRLDPLNDDAQSLLKDSIAAGANYLGATPTFYNDPKKSMQVLIDLASELAVDIDVHLDEHLDPDNSWTETLADLVIDNEFTGRVTIGHACVLSCFDEKRLHRTIDKLAEAGITIISLPLTNLYLQDRSEFSPRQRGLTTIRELSERGVKVLLGTDNVRDAFYPFGDADLLDTAYAGLMASQIDDAHQLTSMICNGIHHVKVGDRADMVLVKGQDFNDVISQRPSDRIIIRNGQNLTT